MPLHSKCQRFFMLLSVKKNFQVLTNSYINSDYRIYFTFIRKKITFLTLFFCFMPSISNAMTDDISKPMLISSDKRSFNYKTGIGIYTGHVIITQGHTHLDADKLITYNNKQHKIREAVAYGLKHPAHYITLLNKNDHNQLFSKANKIKFYPFKSLIRLEGNAVVKHRGDIFKGPVAIYDIEKQTVHAPASKNNRTKIFIQQLN